MKDDRCIVNSDTSLVAFKAKVDQLYHEKRWVTFTWRIGEKRSIPANSLMHLWLTQFAAHLSNCSEKEVTPGMLEGIKRTTKGLYYRETGHEFMIHTIKCPLTGKERRDYTSSSSWTRGEMFAFLSWLQMFAAEKGAILESKGEFKHQQGAQHE